MFTSASRPSRKLWSKVGASGLYPAVGGFFTKLRSRFDLVLDFFINDAAERSDFILATGLATELFFERLPG